MAVFLFVLDWRCQSLLFISLPLFILLLKTPHQRVVFRFKGALLRRSAPPMRRTPSDGITLNTSLICGTESCSKLHFQAIALTTFLVFANLRFPSCLVDVHQFSAGSNVIPERISINGQEWRKGQKIGPKMTIQSKMGDHLLIWGLLGLHQLFL